MADTLDRICRQYHLTTREEAAEWLIKRRLNRSARQLTKRGRALHLVSPK